jgi:phosphoribosyl 1,2-cyclic phosphodiesterase
MLIKFWGVHGSLPRPGPSTLKYGGNTACVEVRCADTLVIFDAGTGIRELGEDLLRHQKGCPGTDCRVRAHIFFSHLHWDHVQGFPFFGPVYKPGNEFHLYGVRGLNLTVHRMMSDQMCRPNFPVALEELAASISFHDLDPGDELAIDDVLIRTARLNHPGGSLGYRVEDQSGKSVIYASDTEFHTDIDSAMLELARNGDVLICDSMFTPEQYLGLWDDLSRESWGHSTWEGAVKLALAANVKQLVLFHHGNVDEVVEQIEAKARERFPGTVAAYEGLEIEL